MLHLLHKLTMPWKWLIYRKGNIIVRAYPDRLYIESTNMCNLSCIMCPRGNGLMRRKTGFMDFDLFKQIIDEMAGKVETVILHTWGEPLLHPRIFDMIQYCAKRKLKTEISTNATLLDKSMAKELLQTNLHTIYLCMDGVTKSTYEKIRRGGDFEKTKNNIQNFIRMKNRLKRKYPIIYLQIVEMQPTINEIGQFKTIWGNLTGVDHINIKILDTWGGQIEAINQLKSREIKLPNRRFHCPNLWYHVHIYWDGTLVCCDRDFNATLPLGNVKNGVMKVWNGERMAQLRYRHITGNLDGIIPCGKCEEWAWWQPTLFSSYGNEPRNIDR